MTGGYLGVTSDHVRNLSEGQNQATNAISVAATFTQGVSGAMWLSHGAVCATSNTAVGMAHSAREAACAAMASTSNDLSQKLNTTAQRYDQTDQQMGQQLDHQMHPR